MIRDALRHYRFKQLEKGGKQYEPVLGTLIELLNIAAHPVS